MDVTLSTGYFNIHDRYADLLLDSNGQTQVLFASPQANGFYEAQGVSGHIPALYVYLSLLFYGRVAQALKPITLFEYTRPDWSFHAKGLWLKPRASNEGWSATIIGSSNYGM